MRIERVEVVEFGRLRRAALDFRPGLNVVFGANEAGKSTLLEALYTLLYGPFKEGLARRQVRSEVRRYDPWSGGTPRGSLVVRTDAGRRYRLDRRLGERPSLAVTDLDSGDDVTARFVSHGRDRFAEEVLGVGGSDYRRTAWVGQAEISDAAGDQSLAERIRNLQETGDEAVYGRRALERIARALEEIGKTDVGQHRVGRAAQRVAELEAQVGRLIERRARLRDVEAQRQLAEERLAALRRSAQELAPLVAAARAAELDADIARWERLQAERDRLRSEVGALAAWAEFRSQDREHLARLADVQREAAAEAAANVERLAQSLAEAADRLARLPSAADLDRAAEAIVHARRQAARRGGRRRLALALGGIGLFALAVGMASGHTTAGILSALALALGAAVAVYGAGRRSDVGQALPFLAGVATAGWEAAVERLRAEREEAARRRDELSAALAAARARAAAAETAAREQAEALRGHVERYGEAGVAEARRRAHAECLERLRQVEETLRILAARFDPEAARRERTALGEVGGAPSEPYAALAERLRAVEAEIERLESEVGAQSEALRLLAPELEALPQLLDELEEARAELARRREQREALRIAEGALGAALEAMHREVTPEITGRFVALLRTAVGDRFGDVVVPADLRPKLGTADEGMRPVEDHSHGTAELVYLCLRMALAEVLGRRERLPLLLDDPLVHLDRQRAGRLLHAVARLTVDGQAILFTCHEREMELVLSEGGHGIRLGDADLPTVEPVP